MNKPLVLVVEDDTPVRNLITTTLKTHEYRYLSAQNGASAVMEALSHNPDIVLLDLGLPDMDGVEIIRKIRSWSNMPIIVILIKSGRWMPGRTIISPSPFPWMNCWRGCE